MNDLEPKIRYGTVADHVQLFEFGRRAFEETFCPYNDPADMAAYLAGAFSPEKQAAELMEPTSVFLIAEISGQMAGFARLLIGPAPAFIQAKRPLELVRIYADKRLIGRGVGSALMQRCLDEASQRSCDVIWLGVWEKNEPALSFYHCWGFIQVGIQPFQLGADLQTDLVMARPV
jgi:GNAT superfamily N-acetyltransferase